MLKIADDGLKRSLLIKKLFKFFDKFGNQDGEGLTLIINGQYGSGKSTLLAFIEEENSKSNKFNIIKYNAWENSFFDNPLIPILYTVSKIENVKDKIKHETLNIFKNFPRFLLRTLSNITNVDTTTLIEKNDIFEEYDTYKESIDRFKQVLSNLCSEKKIIFLVDELDRCLPEYQIKALEAIYHLLDVPNLIVVIAIDKGQLEHSIRTKYGEAVNLFI